MKPDIQKLPKLIIPQPPPGEDVEYLIIDEDGAYHHATKETANIVRITKEDGTIFYAFPEKAA